jgi:hypothetical protein
VSRAANASLSERDLLDGVLELGRLYRWRVAHFRPARTARGWRTPVEADGAGFPDVVLVRERVLFIELKAERGRPSPQQVEWLRALLGAGAEVYVVRPRNLYVVAAVLSGRGPSAASAELRTELAIEVAP